MAGVINLTGTVCSGKQHFSNLPDIWWDFYENKTNRKLFKGSLNIQLSNKISFNNLDFSKYKYINEKDGRYVFLIPAEISFGEKKMNCFVQRIQNVEEENSGYPIKNIIEILSEISFKREWNLKNNDPVSILFN